MMKMIFPRPFAIAIDDLGWINGQNEGEDGFGPYRLGVNRKMTITDYEAVVDLAKKAGVRLQGLFILGEMDRENFLGEYPHTTHMGENWDNSANISDLQIDMLEYVQKQSAHLEFGLHGIGHEFWPEPDKRRRAEWYNTDDDHPWPEKDIRTHVDCFVRIMNQYGISKEKGHSFPESFVPCAYSYYWNPNGSYSIGSVLGEYGVRYANTDFTQIPECNPPKELLGGGFDHKVHVINRYNHGNLWYELGKLPTTDPEDILTDFIETHWPNLLAQDYFLQTEVTDRWTAYYKAIQRSNNRYCAKNTAQMHSQWLYKEYTVVTQVKQGQLEIDNIQMPADVYSDHFPTNMVLKIELNGKHVSTAKLNGKVIPAYYEDEGFGFLYLPQLSQSKYNLEYELGENILENTVWHDGTANIMQVSANGTSAKIDLCLYGTQTIRMISHKKLRDVFCSNSNIKVLAKFNENGMMCIKLSAHNIQGETGSVILKY